ncbi:unnamed protein product [Calicophoron daubneyi]|uniref:Tetraspanin n=1 Tax=Calicophoron daubneyi TaxID=300641 RepID=A0AAV2SWB3_CALDB
MMLSGLITPLLTATGQNNEAAIVSEMLTEILGTTSFIGTVVFALGVTFTVLSGLGYCGACCNFKILLYLYAILMGIIGVALLAFVIAYFSNKDLFGDRVIELFQDSVNKYQSMRANTVHSLIVGLIQTPLKCCGVDNGTLEFKNMANQDFYQGIQYNNLSHPIPCCMMNNEYRLTGPGCPALFNETNSYIAQGCRGPLKSKFYHYTDYVAFGLIGVLFVLAS